MLEWRTRRKTVLAVTHVPLMIYADSLGVVVSGVPTRSRTPGVSAESSQETLQRSSTSSAEACVPCPLPEPCRERNSVRAILSVVS